MPVLPLIDLMILVAWTSMIIGAVQKTLSIALGRPLSAFGFSPTDFVLVAVAALLFALSLAARTWVRAYEPALRRARHQHRGDEVLPDFPAPRTETAQQADRAAAG
jgi:hypothetical protein